MYYPYARKSLKINPLKSNRAASTLAV